ncbi:hypothetical protein [Bradyrhizobium sp. SYSU BS000235]|uniref:hypothetical protein n=1 Tax=Bradyrhizobium sp. SYSU BS000235 TaxID=3411332 RepID=UPI003C716141
MTDERDYLERTDSIWQKAGGEAASLDELANAFALYGPEKRIAALDQFDAELSGGRSGSLRRHHELHSLRRKMGGIHSALMKANR